MTAEIAAGFFNIPEIVTTPLLRERFFGSYNGKSDLLYNEIWQYDRDRKGYESYFIENPESVMSRVLQLVNECEMNFSDENILFVAHGDVIQIGLCLFAGISAYEHRNIPHMQTAEIRKP